jgi:hypothetical protein
MISDHCSRVETSMLGNDATGQYYRWACFFTD